MLNWFQQRRILLLRPTSKVSMSPNRFIYADKFQRQLRDLADRSPGVLGIAVIDLTERSYYGVHERLVFPAASSIKLLIHVCLFEQADLGKLDLQQIVHADFGDGGRERTLEEVARLMIDQSDNHATNLLIDRLGLGTINNLARRIGCPTLVLRRRMLDEAAGKASIENTATPLEAARFMALILDHRLPLTAATSKRLLETGYGTYPEGPVRQQIPAEIPVMQMPGGLAGVRNSWAAVNLPGRPFALAAMGHFGDFETITPFIKSVAQASFDYFRRLAGANEYGVRTGQSAFPPGSGASGT